jgi:hypothetical protein
MGGDAEVWDAHRGVVCPAVQTDLDFARESNLLKVVLKIARIRVERCIDEHSRAIGQKRIIAKFREVGEKFCHVLSCKTQR